MKEVIKPQALRTGDKIAIVSPAGPPVPECLEQGVRLLREHGFNVEVGDHVLSRSGYLAGNDDVRVIDLNKAIQDPDVRGIICSRGGYGSSRILSRIDYDGLAADPKVIVGFSDITAILNAVYARTGLVCFHGPMMSGITSSSWSFNQLLLQISVRAKHPFRWSYPSDSDRPVNTFTGASKTVQGRTLGGCLSILSTLSGTPWCHSPADHILFMEDVGEAPYRIDRLLTHLINSGWFDETKGIITGIFQGCAQKASDTEPTPTVEDVLRERIHQSSLPWFSGLPFGHITDSLTIPIGVEILLSCDGVIQLESAVR